MEIRVIKKRHIVEVVQYDRILMYEFEHKGSYNELTGMNYMQGAGDFDLFERDGFADPDLELTKFVKRYTRKHLPSVMEINDAIEVYTALEEAMSDTDIQDLMTEHKLSKKDLEFIAIVDVLTSSEVHDKEYLIDRIDTHSEEINYKK